MHKASPYDFYDIFAHAKGFVATVGTYFMYVRKTWMCALTITNNTDMHKASPYSMSAQKPRMVEHTLVHKLLVH